jgi:hypothetical protein
LQMELAVLPLAYLRDAVPVLHPAMAMATKVWGISWRRMLQ